MLGEYCRRECLEAVGVPTSIKDDAIECEELNALREIGAEICQHDIGDCHWVKKQSNNIEV